jgi:hypothetical protein
MGLWSKRPRPASCACPATGVALCSPQAQGEILSNAVINVVPDNSNQPLFAVPSGTCKTKLPYPHRWHVFFGSSYPLEPRCVADATWGNQKGGCGVSCRSRRGFKPGSYRFVVLRAPSFFGCRASSGTERCGPAWYACRHQAKGTSTTGSETAVAWERDPIRFAATITSLFRRSLRWNLPAYPLSWNIGGSRFNSGTAECTPVT